jgi:membrane-bound lytic murein transglycosylase D
MTLKSCLPTNFYNCLIILFFLCGCSSLPPEEQLLADLSFLDNIPEVPENISTVKPPEIIQETKLFSPEAENRAGNYGISDDQEIITSEITSEEIIWESDDICPLLKNFPEEGIADTSVINAEKDASPDKTRQKLVKIQPREPEYDFPIIINRQVQFFLDLYQNRQYRTFRTWLERSGRYLPMIHKELKAAGLPLDLAYLPMIESGYRLTAYSRARAAGPWQFISSTGRHYGLSINKYLDERRNVHKSTEAAITFLKELHGIYGDWYLACAAYNGGGRRVSGAIRRAKSKDFWVLSRKRLLKKETRLYVPKLIAAIIIAKSPEKYGFRDLKYHEPLVYETVKVPRWTQLKAIAAAGDLDFENLRNLNRELKRSITPPTIREYVIKVPPGKASQVKKNLPRVKAIVNTGFKIHIYRKGETLTRICRKYRINKTTLLKANKLTSSKIKHGKRLKIPYRTTSYRLLPARPLGPDYKVARELPENLILHKVKPGETVSKLARQYNVPGEMIAVWNGLKNLHSIRAGQQLAFFLHKNNTPIMVSQEKPQLRTKSKTKKAAAISISKPVIRTKQKTAKKRKSKTTAVKKIAILRAVPVKRKPTNSSAVKTAKNSSNIPEPIISYYHVKGGDTLWSIARKFKVTTKKIKSWNNLKKNLIKPGKRLKLVSVK